MPKIIENVREQLIAEVRREIETMGYSKTTVRSVASALNLGLGTVYNYFPSKDMLVASAVSEDWKLSTEEFRSASAGTKRETLERIYSMLSSFIKAHESLFSDSEARRKFASVFTERHIQLRSQIASFVLPVLERTEDAQFLSLFIAESMLTWVMEDVPFVKLYDVIGKLLQDTDKETNS